MSFVPELQINLTLVRVEMPYETDLRITVRKSVGDKKPESAVGRSAWDVLSYPSISEPSPSYEIYFPDFITYCVTDENLYAGDPDSESEGIQFRRFKKSRFLEYVQSITYGPDIHPGSRFHYGIYCLNMCVDVIAVSAPTIRFLGEY